MRSFALVSLILTAVPATAHEVMLKLVPGSSQVRCEVTGFSVRAAADKMSEIPLTQSVPIGESAVSVPLTLAQLPADVVPIAKGCWSPTVHVPVDSVAPIVVEMWPAATVLGGIAFEGKAEKPRTIAGSLVDPSIDRAPESVACELESNVWRCFVPAGRPLHLQVMIDDFAPLFVWDVDIKPGGVEDTGIHMLVRGAAIAGRAVLDRGRPAVNANVQILPLTAGEQKATDRRAKSRQTRTNATGHFQLAGLEAGIYRVVSTMAERGDAVIESIELRAGEHLLLREPLFHAELAEIALLLSPPVSPSQTPWTVELLRRGEREAELVSVANGPASEGGAWNKAGLPPTSYVLRILGPGGSRIVARDIVLRGGREQVVIDVATIGATGKVLAGDKGIAADLTFEHEGRNVTATSNEDGEFIADFPVAGSWKASVTVDAAKVQLEPVEVTAPQEKDLILRIPGGGVKGTVVDQNGRSTAGSLVLLRRGIRQVSRTYSDERGDFHLIGVEAGDYTISAEADDSFGGPLSLTLAKDEIAHVELRLESWKEVSGTVTTPSGAAASGAVVRHFDPLTGMVEDTIADAGGEFSFKVKARSRTIDLVVLAPPHPIAMRQLHLGDRPSLSANVQLAPAGTRLRVYILRSPPWPMLTAPDGVQRSLGLLLMPLFGRGVWREFVDGGFNFFVEPGPYVICGDGRAQCQQLQLAPHAEAVVNFLPAAATGTN